MSRGLAVLAVFIAAFIVLMGILGVFAGIATAFPTTEDSFVRIGAELKGAVLAVIGVVVVAVGLFLTRLAGRLSNPTS
jgi:hypothetical protein